MMCTTSIPDSYRSRFPNIPAQLFTYLDHLLEKPSTGSQFHAAMINHPEKTFEVLDSQFKSDAEIVSLSPDDLLKKLDFNRKDLSPERIGSLLGELRTIHFLHNNGFTDIVPILFGIEVAVKIFEQGRKLKRKSDGYHKT